MQYAQTEMSYDANFVHMGSDVKWLNNLVLDLGFSIAVWSIARGEDIILHQLQDGFPKF